MLSGGDFGKRTVRAVPYVGIEARLLIDGALSEGMGYSTYGCILKATYYIDAAVQEKDDDTAMMNRKAAWINMVNAYRMLDDISHDIHNPETKREISSQLKEINTHLDHIGKTSFNWDTKKTKEMYGKTKMMIEERMKEINSSCLAH